VNVQRSVHIPRPPKAAFDLFTAGIGSWWPLHQGFSFGGDRAEGIFLDARVGGRLYERFVDGDEYQVGEVTSCEPPERIVFTWRAPGWQADTEVDIRFRPEGDGTRVDLDHRYFERLGPEGPTWHREFGSGWPTVLDAYVRAAGSPGPP
jgi:uncharacterized protein YndB with AHSA1/START domain